MIPFLAKRKNKKTAKALEVKLLERLQSLLPDLYENHQYWRTKFIRIEDGSITFSHICYEPEYVEKNRRKHNRNYRLKQLQLKRAETSQPVTFEVSVGLDLINTVYLSTRDLYKAYDWESIDVSNMVIEEVVYENNDKKALLRIIGHLTEEQLARLEVDDSIEIELNSRKYYTILDMEDGNYIAVDRKAKVYRLHHDSSEQAQVIATSIEDFLDSYEGKKATLAHLFN